MVFINLTQEDNNRTIELPLGKVATIHLPGNPATGYTWTRVGFEKLPELSDEKLKITTTYKPAARGLIGGGGEFYINVTPLLAGTHKLELVYARPFEEVKKSAKRFTLTIKAK